MGRKPILLGKIIRLWYKYVLQCCAEPLYIIMQRFNGAAGYKISEKTVQLHVRKLKADSYLAIQKPYLSNKNLNPRIPCARLHENWTLSQWSNMLFTHQSSFSVRPMKSKLRVWRNLGTKMDLHTMVPTYKSGFQTMNVCR